MLRTMGLSLIGIYIIVILYEFILISLEKGIFGALGPTLFISLPLIAVFIIAILTSNYKES